MDSTSSNAHGRESLDNTTEAPPSKRLKVEDSTEESKSAPDSSVTLSVGPSDSASVTTKESILPPSHSLLGTAPPLQDESGAIIRLMESDVGISEYIAKHVPKIGGIIKQRYRTTSILYNSTKGINSSKVY
jgi:tRNA pseudouridine13 synthase